MRRNLQNKCISAVAGVAICWCQWQCHAIRAAIALQTQLIAGQFYCIVELAMQSCKFICVEKRIEGTLISLLHNS